MRQEVPPPAVDLSTFENRAYEPGRGFVVQSLWFFLGLPLLRSSWIPSSGFRVALLRAFGAKVGKGCVIKPRVRVKYPWRLRAGNHCWIGEDAWIDNLADVVVGNNVCVSQGVYLCTGNHDWSDRAFGLVTKSISLSDGAWVAARASLAPGTSVGECGVVGFGSVLTSRVPPFEIYAGNPAVFQRNRSMAAVSEEEVVPCHS